MNSGSKLTELDPHQRYKELSALAGAGQLSESEAVELNEHLKGCEECRGLVRDFAFLCVQVLPAITTSKPLPPEMTERFIARARSEGIAISDAAKEAILPKGKQSPPRNVWKTAFWAAVAASLFIVGSLAWMVRERWQPSSVRNVANRTDWHTDQGTPQKSSSGTEPNGNGIAPDITLEARLRSTEARLANLSEELKQRQRELDRLKQAPRNNSSTSAEAELRTLRATLERQRRRLSDILRLNAAERSSGGLRTTHNVHVIDVLPIDEQGKPRNEFAGRVLYIEGESLEFYALDLDHYKDAGANSTFYLWGRLKNAAEGPVIPLGRFSLDNTKDNRWIVVVSDPAVLAGLRSVFVTVEHNPNPVTPTGKKLLNTILHFKPD